MQSVTLKMDGDWPSVTFKPTNQGLWLVWFGFASFHSSMLWANRWQTSVCRSGLVNISDSKVFSAIFHFFGFKMPLTRLPCPERPRCSLTEATWLFIFFF